MKSHGFVLQPLHSHMVILGKLRLPPSSIIRYQPNVGGWEGLASHWPSVSDSAIYPAVGWRPSEETLPTLGWQNKASCSYCVKWAAWGFTFWCSILEQFTIRLDFPVCALWYQLMLQMIFNTRHPFLFIGCTRIYSCRSHFIQVKRFVEIFYTVFCVAESRALLNVWKLLDGLSETVFEILCKI